MRWIKWTDDGNVGYCTVEPSVESNDCCCCCWSCWASVSLLDALASDELVILRRVSCGALFEDSGGELDVVVAPGLLWLWAADKPGQDVFGLTEFNGVGSGGASGIVAIVDVLVTVLAKLDVRCLIFAT